MSFLHNRVDMDSFFKAKQINSRGIFPFKVNVKDLKKVCILNFTYTFVVSFIFISFAFFQTFWSRNKERCVLHDVYVRLTKELFNRNFLNEKRMKRVYVWVRIKLCRNLRRLKLPIDLFCIFFIIAIGIINSACYIISSFNYDCSRKVKCIRYGNTQNSLIIL